MPGLAENRPSVLVGDSVFVAVHNYEYHTNTTKKFDEGDEGNLITKDMKG